MVSAIHIAGMAVGKSTKKWDIWKKLAIAGIGVFLIILLLTGIKVIRFKYYLSDVSEEQNGIVLSLLKEISDNEDYSLEDYTISIHDKIREISIDNQKRHILMVNLKGENNVRSYIIDTDNWGILQSSQTKYDGWMAKRNGDFSSRTGKGRWFHNQFWGIK
jgi:hypothetical protein